MSDYVQPDSPEVCQDPHHRDSRIAHDPTKHCCQCETCLRDIKGAYVNAHQGAHRLDHPSREPTVH